MNNPYIRDKIEVDADFNGRLSATGSGPLFFLARVIELHAEMQVGARSVVIVADEFLGNGHLVNAMGASSSSSGLDGAHAVAAVPPDGASGQSGGDGGAGGAGGSVTVMCRRSSGVHINTSGGAGAAGGNGGNGEAGAPVHVIPGKVTTTIEITPEGLPIEVTTQEPDIELPGTLGGFGGGGGAGGSGGNAGNIQFTSIVDDSAPVLVATGGPGAPGGAGGLPGPHGAGVPIPEDFDNSPFPGAFGTTGADGTVAVATVTEEEYVAGLRPLLDNDVDSFANHWAPYRLIVGQYYYRQDRKSDPTKGQLAATEFARTLELQPNNPDAVQWNRQFMEFPRPRPVTPDIAWEPGGLNALALPRDLDVLPRFQTFANTFAAFSILVLDFLRSGTTVIGQQAQFDTWQAFLTKQRDAAVAAQAKTLEDREQAETEARFSAEAIASVQARLDQTTADIQAAMEEMREEEMSFGDIVGTVASVAAAVVAVVAAVPSLGASLVALAPSMVALSSAVLDDADDIAKAVLAGDPADTEAIKKAYDKVDKQSADVVKGAKAIVSFVEVVQKLSKSVTPDNSKHVALVRHGIELTHELLLARHRITLADQRQEAAVARVARAGEAIAGINAVIAEVSTSAERFRRTALHAIAIAEGKADALLTLAFYAQRSAEIYTLNDHEDKVHLESGHLHPDDFRAYLEGEITEIDLVGLLDASWSGLLGLLQLQVEFDQFTTQFHEPDRRRLSFAAGGPEVETLRATRRFPFRIDASSLPADQFDAKARGVRLALVGATHPAGEVTCEIRHGSAYETRRNGGAIHVAILQPRVSTRNAKLERLLADEGLGPDPVLTDPTSLSFWGRGIGGDYEFSIPDHEFDAGLDLTGLTEVQIWISYQFLR